MLYAVVDSLVMITDMCAVKPLKNLNVKYRPLLVTFSHKKGTILNTYYKYRYSVQHALAVISEAVL